jgi:ATPase subunit of ABC transporter with duplicated ATPase domains
MEKEVGVTHDYGTNCVDCDRYTKLGDVCVLEHGKKFLWEFCRDFVPKVELPDYNDLMRTVKQEQAVERQKAKEKKEREKKKKLKERLAKKEQKRKDRRNRLRRIRERKKREEQKRKERLSKKKSSKALGGRKERETMSDETHGKGNPEPTEE